jgi:type II secretory pathway pseudopilin PulG
MLHRTVINTGNCAKTAFTLAELLIAVLFLGIFAYIAVPRMQTSIIERYKGKSAAQKLVTDLRLVRNLAITEAAGNTAGFALQMAGTSPYSGYTIINLSNGQTVAAHTIDTKISCGGGALFKFGPIGNLLAGSDTQLVISSAGKTSTIGITAATGAVQCVEN